MENFERITKTISVHFQKALLMRIKEPFGIENYCYKQENTFIYVKKGNVYYGKNKEVVHAGEVLFIPSGKATSLNFSEPNPKHIFGNDYHEQSKEYILDPGEVPKSSLSTALCVRVEAKVFNALDLFMSLDISLFVIKDNEKILRALSDIHEDANSESVGKATLLECKCKELVLRLFRHIIEQRLFVQQISINSSNLNDEKLIALFRYINENLSSNLSNKRLSVITQVSEDYVGQYFKTLTGINPQDYIESQRMQRAVLLLRSSNKNVRDIGREVGYKDSSYFCRRFKMMFGISAGRMRRRESAQTTVV